MIASRLWQWANIFWSKNRRWILDVILILALIVLAIVIYIMGTPAKFPQWMGVESYTDTTGEFHPGITLWDWLGLLIIPAILAAGAYWFNRQERALDCKLEEERARIDRLIAQEGEREIAEKRFQDQVLQDYLDKMTDLLLNKQLRLSEDEAEVRAIARARTLAALRLLDGYRKGQLVKFLWESKLLERGNPIVSLEGADLQKAELKSARLENADLTKIDGKNSILDGAHLINVKFIGSDLERASFKAANLGNVNFRDAYLIKANFRGANLQRANLRLAIFKETNLMGAYLEGADLREVYLEGADLRGATVEKEQLSKASSLLNAILPDGSVWKEEKYRSGG